MKILGIDIETGSSFDTPKEETTVTEIGLVLWETEKNTPLEIVNILVDEEREIHPEASEYTGIDEDMIADHGIFGLDACRVLVSMAEKAERIVAHNGNQFDKPVLEGLLKRFSYSNTSESWRANWIDTQSDIDYPSNMRSRSLIYLAASHGFVNPFPHRAVTDVLTMLQILSKYQIDTIIGNADSPRVRIVAQVSYDGRQKAKDSGFYWDGENKEWFREMRKNQVDKFSRELKFQTRIIEL